MTTRPAGSVVRDGIEGRIVPERDPVALADAIAEIVEDRDKRAQMSLAARQRARELHLGALRRAARGCAEERRLAMTFTIMITTHNRSADLRRTSAALMLLSPAPDEILICADSCTDDTVAMIVREFPGFVVLENAATAGIGRFTGPDVATCVS